MTDKNMFYKYQESRAQSGYGGALLVKEQGESKYVLLIPLETVPSFFGSQESFDFNLLNSPVKGKVAGKMEMEDSSCEFLWHRDMLWRLEQYVDKVLDFLVIAKDYTGTKATGSFTYHQNEKSADVDKGTINFSIMSGSPRPILNCRPLILEPLCFADVIPDEVTAGDSVNLTLVQSEVTATYKTFTIDDSNQASEKTSATVSNGVWTATGSDQIVGIEVSADGYASWTTTIYVNKKST